MSPSPLICPQQASEIKSSLYIIHRAEADRATVERKEEGWGQREERAGRGDKTNKRKIREDGTREKRERQWLTGLCIKGTTVRS